MAWVFTGEIENKQPNPIILVYLSQMATPSSLLLDARLQFLSCKNIVAIPYSKSTTLSSLFIVIFIIVFVQNVTIFTIYTYF